MSRREINSILQFKGCETVYDIVRIYLGRALWAQCRKAGQSRCLYNVSIQLIYIFVLTKVEIKTRKHYEEQKIGTNNKTSIQQIFTLKTIFSLDNRSVCPVN